MSGITMEQTYITACLHKLAVEIGIRPAGSPAQHAARDYVAAEMKKAGLDVFLQSYPCPAWTLEEAALRVNGEPVVMNVNRHSPACSADGFLYPINSQEQLENADLSGRIALLHNDLCGNGFFPKNFDYFRDETQDRTIRLLEEKKPQAVIFINPFEGPCPGMLEDVDFSIPSVTVAQETGQMLLSIPDASVSLNIVSQRRDSTGANVIGRRPGKTGKKFVFCAHYDSNSCSPGALDNGAGIAALLLLSRHLSKLETSHALEFVAFGGEDSWYPGDKLYVEEFPTDLIAAAVNIDGIGMKGSRPAISLFEWPETLEKRILDLAGPTYSPEPFYESDHGFFWPLGIPTAALTTSTYIGNILGKTVHTMNDTPEIVDTDQVVQAAALVRDMTVMLDQELP